MTEWSASGNTMNDFVFVDYRLSENCLAAFRRLGFVVIRLPPFRNLPAPVAAHPDMLVYRLGDQLLMPAEYLDAHRRIFSHYGLPIVGAEDFFSPLYPHDVPLNCLSLSDGRVFGREGSAAARIRQSAVKFIPCRQGYARCSVCLLTDGAAITADPSMERALRGEGLDVLKIMPGGILLPGYDTGFIGGCGGELKKGRYAFFGDLSLHSDCDAIRSFAARHGVTLTSLTEEILTDHGGFVTFRC